MRVRYSKFNSIAYYEHIKNMLPDAGTEFFTSHIEGEVIATYVGGFFSSSYFLIKTDSGFFIKAPTADCVEIDN